MTNIYLIRHAEAERNVRTEIKKLTAQGRKDSEKVANFLYDKKIDVIISSHYRRCIETLEAFSICQKLKIIEDERFCERKRNSSLHLTDEAFKSLMQQLFDDFNYRPERGEENFAELQERAIAALEEILAKYDGKNIVIGTHIITMYSIMKKYDHGHGFEKFWDNLNKMPFAVKMSFDENAYVKIEEIDL